MIGLSGNMVVAGVANDARPPGVLFVDHSSKLAGAEMVLLDIVRGFPGSTVLLMETGPLQDRLRQAGCDLSVTVARSAPDMSRVTRDGSLWRAAGMAGGLASTVQEIATAARQHAVIYANSQKAFVLSAAAARLARRPLVWHLHDILTASHFGRAQVRLVIALANIFAARVVVPSRAVADAFIAAGGNPDLLQQVANGVEVCAQPVEAAPVPSVRDEFGLGDSFTFGVFSRLAGWKGQHVAIDALAQMPGARCLMAGGPLFGEFDYEARLHAQARRLGVADRLCFLGHRNDVRRLMAGIDCVLHPSVEAEPFGLTIVEAMLARTPLVATAIGASDELLDGGRCGLLVPPGDAAAIAAALREVRDRPGARAQAVDAAEARAAALYDARRMRQAIRQMVRDVIATASPARQGTRRDRTINAA